MDLSNSSDRSHAFSIEIPFIIINISGDITAIGRFVHHIAFEVTGVCPCLSVSNLYALHIRSYTHVHLSQQIMPQVVVPALIPLPLQYAPATMLLQSTRVPKHVRPPPHLV